MKTIKLRIIILLGIPAALYICFGSCIQRDNEWDPINGCHPMEVPDMREKFIREIDALVNATNRLTDSIKVIRKKFHLLIDTNTVRQQQNSLVLKLIDSLILLNNKIEETNSLRRDCDSMVLKIPISIGSFDLFTMEYMILDSSGIAEILKLKENIFAVIARARDTCPKREVLSVEYVDSINRFFGQWDIILDSIKQYNNRMLDYNSSFKPDSIRQAISVENSCIAQYNDSIELCCLDWIEDTTGIQQTIDSIKPGETIAIGLDSIHIPDGLIKRKGETGVWTIIRGKPSKKTIITSPRMQVDSSFNIKFVDIIFTDMGNNIGVRVINNSDSIVFSRCIFRDNSEKGMEASKCRNLIIESCEFVCNGNSADSTGIGLGGLRISECRNSIVLENILVARNFGVGIEINKSFVSLWGGTISDNTLDGVRYMGPEGTGSFVSKSSIFSFNKGYGVFRNNENTTLDIFVSSDKGNRFFGNGAGDLGGDPGMVERNQPVENIDPMFADRNSGDYRISEKSPLYGKNIGYRYP